MAAKKKGRARALAETLRGNDEIIFRIEWDPDRILATLDHLLYNGDLIEDGGIEETPGSVKLTFHRASMPVHRFQWSLLFPGKKLAGLKAFASVNGVDGDLGDAETAENRWAAEGDWNGEDE